MCLVASCVEAVLARAINPSCVTYMLFYAVCIYAPPSPFILHVVSSIATMRLLCALLHLSLPRRKCQLSCFWVWGAERGKRRATRTNSHNSIQLPGPAIYRCVLKQAMFVYTYIVCRYIHTYIHYIDGVHEAFTR